MSSRLSFQSKNNGATKNNSRRSTLPAYYTVQLQICSAFMFSSLLVVSTSLLLSTHWYCTDHHKQNKTKKTKTRVDQHTIFFNNRFNITHAFLKNSYFSHQTSNVLWCTCSVQNTPQYPVVTGYLATVQ